MANDVSVEITIEEKQALRALSKLVKGVDKFGTEAKKGVKTADIAIGAFAGGAALKAASAAIGAVVSGFRLLTSAGSDAIDAASVQEDAINALNAQLKISGNLTKENSENLQEFASELQAVTKFGDEAIIGQLAFAQAMGASVEESKSIVSASADMAASLNIDLNSAVRNVAKTLGGYAGELGEVIPELKNLTQEQLRAGAGVELLAKKFAGAATAQIKTYSGAMTQLTNITGDTSESFGRIVTQSPIVIAAIKGLSTGFQEITKFVDANAESMRSFANDVILGAIIGSIKVASSAIIGFNGALVSTKNFLNFISDIALASVENILEFALGAQSAATSVRKFFGLSTAGAESSANAIKKQIEIVKLSRQANDEEVASRLKSHEELESSVKNLSGTITGAIQKEVDAVKVGTQEITNENLKRVESEKQVSEETKKLREQATIAEQERNALKAIEEEEKHIMNIELLSQRFGQEQAIEIEHQAKLAEIKSGAAASDAKRRELVAKAETKSIKDRQKRERDGFLAGKKFSELSNREKVQNLQGTLGTIATLQQSSNKELFAIGKAAALANHALNVPSAISKAINSAPPPFNFALAALVGTAMAIQGAKIASAKPPAFQGGGVIGGFQGASPGPDNVTVEARRGEMFLNSQQQRNLFDTVNSGIGSAETAPILGQIRDSINRLVDSGTRIEIDGREVFRAVRNEGLRGAVA